MGSYNTENENSNNTQKPKRNPCQKYNQTEIQKEGCESQIPLLYKSKGCQNDQSNQDNHSLLSDRLESCEMKTISDIPSVLLRCISICMGAIFTGYNLGSYSFVQPTMTYVLDNDKGYVDGLCNALVTVGIGFGSLLANQLLNRWIKQRRMFIFLCDSIGIASSLLQMFPTLFLIAPGRFFGGVSAGFNFLICPIYIKEFVPMDWVGTCISIYSNSVNVGVMMAYLVGFSLSEDVKNNVPYIWRLNLAFPVVFIILRSLLILFIYKIDTPCFYLDRKDEETAKLAMLQTHNYRVIDTQLEQQKLNLEKTEQAKVKVSHLLSKRYRKRLLMAVFSSSTEALTGLMIFTAFSWMIYGKVVSQTWSKAFSILQVGVQICGTLCLGRLIQIYGRKQIMVIVLMFNLLAQCLLTFATYMVEQGHDSAFFAFLTIFSLQSYYACLGFGISCIAFLIVVDLVPQSGISIANAFMALFNSIYSFGFPVLIEHIPMWQALLILCFSDLFVLIVFKFWVIETKNLNEDQLNDIFYKTE